MKIVEVRENLSKRKTREKRRGKLMSHNSFTHLFNIQMTKFIYYPTVYIRSNCLFFAMSWVSELLPGQYFFTIDWHYTMAWLPALLLKHTGAYRHAQQRCTYGSFIKGDVVQQR